MLARVKERVLIVDDEPQILVALEDLLSDQFIVLKQESAEGALELMAHEHDIAVVITDQCMPRMTGDEMLTRLGASPSLRIMLTGFADLSAVIRAVNDGKIFSYVTKPWNAEDLRLKVSKAVEHFRLGQELADERQMLHDLMDNIPDGIYFKDLDLRFRRTNKAYASSLSHEPESLVDKRLDEVVAMPAGATNGESDEFRILSDRRPELDVVRERRLLGVTEWFSETKAPICNTQGSVVGLVGISRNVTQRVRTEEALRKSEERFRDQTSILNSILDSMGDGLVVADLSGKFLVFNRQAERIFGGRPGAQSADDWARSCLAYLADRENRVVPEKNPLLSALHGNETGESEIFIRSREGRGTLVAVSGAPLTGDGGALAGGIALLRDVTEHRQLEDQLRHAQKMEAIGRLAGSVAHDFNNLLSVILSYSALLLGDLDPQDPTHADVTAIKRAGERAADLTRQLLAFGRKQVLAPRVLDLNEVVRESEKMLRRLLGEDVELETRYDASLARVRLDPGQLDQVVMNLAINARDAMPEGGKLTIETSSAIFDGSHAAAHSDAPAATHVMLALSDTGVGMDKETRSRIFEPFFTTKEKGKGTGLGLSTVFGIVEQSGGTIHVQSEVGAGTTFKVYFPKADAVAPSVRPPVELVTLDGTETVLLVEDQDEVRQVAYDVLRRHGYQVIATRNAGEALLECERHAGVIHLLLTDVVMPRMNGRELAERLLQIRRDLRVLYMSGYTEDGIVHQGTLDSGIAYLQKPLVPEALARRVREVLDTPSTR